MGLSISAMFPCYNDRGTIADLVSKTDSILSRYTDDYEIIVVDDFSNDGARDVLAALLKKHKKLKVVLHDENMGYGATIIDGLVNSSKEWYFYTDGDGQYDVTDIEKMIPFLKENVDLVNGFKIKRMDPAYRIIIGSLYNIFMKFIFGIKISDVDCDFRIMRSSMLKNKKFFSKSGTICIEMVKTMELSEAKIVEIPVNHYNREYGTSQFFNFKRLFFVFFHILILWWILIGRRK